MLRNIVVIILLHFITHLSGQVPQLHIDGSGELAIFQNDLSLGNGAILELTGSQNFSYGYVGVHPERISDMEFGVTNNFGDVTFSFLNVPKLRITQSGDVRLSKLIGSNFGQIYASPEGKLSKLEGEQIHTVHYAHFRPSEEDGEFVEIVQPVDEVEFVKFNGSAGVLSAPIQLPRGAIITKFKVYFVNESNAQETFKAHIQRATSDATSINQAVSPALDLPVDGNFFSTNFTDGVTIATRELSIAPIKIDYSSFFYNVIVECTDCPDQYIRAIDIIYEF